MQPIEMGSKPLGVPFMALDIARPMDQALVFLFKVGVLSRERFVLRVELRRGHRAVVIHGGRPGGWITDTKPSGKRGGFVVLQSGHGMPGRMQSGSWPSR